MAAVGIRERDRRILNLVVEDFIRHGRPVSSGAIVQTGKVAVSPATVRNAMVRLEGLGYLSQPHTSAGRVPTDKGLRSYAEALLSETRYASEETSFVQDDPASRPGDFETLLSQASRVLADSSDNVGFVISPNVSRVQFEQVRFVRIANQRIMVILVTPFHMVLTDTLDTLVPMTQLELDRATQYINQNFRGRTLLAVREILLQDLPRHRARYEDTISRLIDLVKASIDRQEGENRIFIQGTAQLLDKPDLSEMSRLKSLFRNLEEKANLVKLLSDFISLGQVKVLIGAEIDFPGVQDCSLVLSHYGTNHQVLGSLGIIGPRRIPYEKIIPLVDRVAKRLSRTIMIYGREVS
jgi:heat-inducible transcriptional repressor